VGAVVPLGVITAAAAARGELHVGCVSPTPTPTPARAVRLAVVGWDGEISTAAARTAAASASRGREMTEVADSLRVTR
jgi:hypothetical protein